MVFNFFKSLKSANKNNKHINTHIENNDEERIRKANEQFYSEFDFEDDGSIDCDGYWNFCPVLKQLIEKGCPPAREIVLSAYGNTDISLNVSWGNSPEFDDLAVTVLYFGKPIRFWREISIHEDIVSDEYEDYKKYECQLDMNELERFIEELQEMSVMAIEFYWYGEDLSRELYGGEMTEIAKHITVEAL